MEEETWQGKEDGGEGRKDPPATGLLEQAGSGAECRGAPGKSACDWQPSRAGSGGRPSALDVRQTQTPLGSNTEWSVPVSCPSRLQHSPARHGSDGTFDPFAAPQQEEPAGLTPLGGQPVSRRPVAPPAVHRKPLCDISPPQAAAPAAAAALFAGRVQSCPPERVGRRGARHVVRLRVKRSLNGAVAAAAGPQSLLARRSLDIMPLIAGPPSTQLAGCSRKRVEAELVSPPMPRKASRTLLDEQQAADMMARLQLAPGQSGILGATEPAAASWTAAGTVLQRKPSTDGPMS